MPKYSRRQREEARAIIAANRLGCITFYGTLLVMALAILFSQLQKGQ